MLIKSAGLDMPIREVRFFHDTEHKPWKCSKVELLLADNKNLKTAFDALRDVTSAENISLRQEIERLRRNGAIEKESLRLCIEQLRFAIHNVEGDTTNLTALVESLMRDLDSC